MDAVEYKHLMGRAGFGVTLSGLKDSSTKSREEVLRNIFDASKTATPLEIVDKVEMEDIVNDYLGRAPGAMKKMKGKMLYEHTRDLNVAWIRRMITTEAQLREKMTFFWHCHFACRDDNPYFLQMLNNSMRQHALGKFKDLLLAIVQSPAILNFLNNQENFKSAPNENFARELMELFTLGRGNYTESDVKEIARAFTGWSFSKETLQFQFNREQHDNGGKEIFGKYGNFDGEGIIELILAKKECAIFIAKKIYRFFVEDKINEEHCNALAEKFYLSGYDIMVLMNEIFNAPWFWEPDKVAVKIKSPVEFFTGISRLLGTTYVNNEYLTSEDSIFGIQKALSQILFIPPNVAGWPGGQRWINNFTLAYRMMGVKRIIDMADNTANLIAQGKQEGKQVNDLGPVINWEMLERHFEGDRVADLLEQVNICMLVKGQVTPENMDEIASKPRVEKLKYLFSWVGGNPQYQLC